MPDIDDGRDLGVAVVCGSACTSGLRAGKFFELHVNRSHVALFASFGSTVGGKISVMSMVQYRLKQKNIERNKIHAQTRQR